MALSDLAVYSEYLYTTKTEVLAQQIDLFNATSNGTIILQASAHQGDFSDNVLFAKISGGTVRRRNAYGSGAVSEKVLAHLVDTSVKVASGTPPIRLDPGQFNWIQQNPEVAGAAMGMQIAKDTFADMLNTALGCYVAAVGAQASNVNNISGATAPADKITWTALNDTAFKLGDSQSDVKAWLMHSAMLNALWNNNLTNAQSLFNFGNVSVIQDFAGRPIFVTDSSNLVASTVYSTLGLKQGAIYIGENNDFDAAEETKTGDENLKRIYQAEWSYNVGIQGFAWDKTNGGKSPNDAALFTATNWDKYATSSKDLAGVILKTH